MNYSIWSPVMNGHYAWKRVATVAEADLRAALESVSVPSSVAIPADFGPLKGKVDCSQDEMAEALNEVRFESAFDEIRYRAVQLARDYCLANGLELDFRSVAPTILEGWRGFVSAEAYRLSNGSKAFINVRICPISPMSRAVVLYLDAAGAAAVIPMEWRHLRRHLLAEKAGLQSQGLLASAAVAANAGQSLFGSAGYQARIMSTNHCKGV